MEFQDIDQQFEFNQGKNLFSKQVLSSLKFSADTIKAIEKIDFIDADSENLMIDYITDRAVQEFCRINQYYTFDKQARLVLRNLYVELIENIKSREFSTELIAEKHYGNLIRWLHKTNSFAEKIYSSKGETIQPVVCSEYSSDLQLNVLQIDIHNLMEPVLDVGCGKQGDLVLFLRQKGIIAFGFDRFADENPYLTNSDWFEYIFEKGKWGTIISNLAFSNHFHHHHLRSNGNFIDYARRYMEIINSLKEGGSFHYAPDLPFIEQYLDKDKFKINKHSLGQYQFNSTIIKRIK